MASWNETPAAATSALATLKRWVLWVCDAYAGTLDEREAACHAAAAAMRRNDR